jgi:fimbrial chaperone protein
MNFFYSRFKPFSLLLAVIGSLFVNVMHGGAGTFQVAPTQLFLSAKTPSAMLALSNESSEALRFQLAVFAWDQNTAGEVLLSATDDIIFFPVLFTLKPGETRNIRVGTSAPRAEVEKTYRLYVEELPQHHAGESAGEVRILTRFGIPIFLQPDKAAAQPQINNIAIEGGRLSFEIQNAGNMHFFPRQIEISGYSFAGERVFGQNLNGWYILAGKARIYDIPLPKALCASIKAVTVEVQHGNDTVQRQIVSPLESCLVN